MKVTPHMSSTQTFRELTYAMRPQDPRGDGTGLRFETGEHGGVTIPTTCPRRSRGPTPRAGGPRTFLYGAMGRSWCRTVGPIEGQTTVAKARCAEVTGR